MGRKRPGTGVEPLTSCIRVRFRWNGKLHRETLQLEPTTANIKATERMMARVHQEIDLGIFDYESTFPKSGTKKKRKKHMKSILPGDQPGICYLCGSRQRIECWQWLNVQ